MDVRYTKSILIAKTQAIADHCDDKETRTNCLKLVEMNGDVGALIWLHHLNPSLTNGQCVPYHYF